MLQLASLNNEVLQEALTTLCTTSPEKLRSFHPLLSDLITNLATGTARTQRQAERVVGELIFLIDCGVDVSQIPKTIPLQYQWVEKQVRQKIRERQERYEKELTDPFLQRLCSEDTLRIQRFPKLIADLLITDSSYCNIALITVVRETLLPKRAERTAPENHISRHLTFLRASAAMRQKLSLIQTPRENSPGAALVRITLLQPHEHHITVSDTRKTCLGALLTWHRQGDLGDCFVSAEYEFSADEASLWLMDDFKELIEKGELTRTSERRVITVDGFTWPAPFIGNSTIRNMGKKQLLSLYQLPLFRQALLELGAVSEDQWKSVVDKDPPYDIRSLFLKITPNIDAVQRALLWIESQGHNSLQRQWQNAASSLLYVSPRRAAGIAEAIHTAMEKIAQTYSLSPQLKQPTAIPQLCSRLHFDVVPQSPQEVTQTTEGELSIICVLHEEGRRKKLSQVDLQQLLMETFIQSYPDIPQDKVEKEKLFQAFIDELKKHGIISKDAHVSEIGGVVLLTREGGLIEQNIFERQLVPGSFQSKPYGVEVMLAMTKRLIENRKEMPFERTLLVRDKNHVFRLLLTHKSRIAWCHRPEEAIEEHIAFSNRFRDTRRSFREWFEILRSKGLVTKESVLNITPPEVEGTVSEFIDAFHNLWQWRSEEEKQNEKKNLLLRFMVNESLEAGRIPILHYADSNWKLDEETMIPVHFGLMYNPFDEKWSHVTVDDKDTPSTVSEDSPYPGQLYFPIAISPSLREAVSQKELLMLQQKTQKYLDQVKLDFLSLLQALERSIYQESDIGKIRDLLEEPMPTTVPRKAMKEVPTTFEECLRLAYEMHVRYLHLLDDVAENPGAYRTIYLTPQALLLADISQLKSKIKEILKDRERCERIRQIFDDWKKSKEPSPESLQQAKEGLSLILKELLTDTRASLSGLDEQRKLAMISLLESFKTHYPQDAAIQEATVAWFNALQ